MTDSTLLYFTCGLIIGSIVSRPIVEYLKGVIEFKDWLWFK